MSNKRRKWPRSKNIMGPKDKWMRYTIWAVGILMSPSIWILVSRIKGEGLRGHKAREVDLKDHRILARLAEAYRRIE